MSTNASSPRAKLYVILGSHACRSAILILEHKRLPFDTVELPTGMHPALVRLCGFRREGAPRKIEGRSYRMLTMVDQLGTVPALRLGEQRVMSNHSIARLLEQTRPQPALFPADAALRERVEEVERWADEVFQMAARRTVLSATANSHLLDNGGTGRLGPLLFRNGRVRQGAARTFGVGFAATPGVEQGLLGGANAMFDEIDGWIGEGLLDGEQLNVADFMIAPSVALLEYHRELHDEIAQRPLGRMLERVMPLDAASVQGAGAQPAGASAS